MRCLCFLLLLLLLPTVECPLSMCPPLVASAGLTSMFNFSHAAKVAPNRVCCNALLAAYARAKPPQWHKASCCLSRALLPSAHPVFCCLYSAPQQQPPEIASTWQKQPFKHSADSTNTSYACSLLPVP